MKQYRCEKFDLTDFVLEEHLYKKKSKKVIYSIVFNDTDIVSTSRLIYDQNNGYISLVYTNPTFRGNQICFNNIKKIIEYAKKIKLMTVSLNVNNDNLGAIKCYNKCGFKTIKKNDIEQKMIYHLLNQ